MAYLLEASTGPVSVKVGCTHEAPLVATWWINDTYNEAVKTLCSARYTIDGSSSLPSERPAVSHKTGISIHNRVAYANL